MLLRDGKGVMSNENKIRFVQRIWLILTGHKIKSSVAKNALNGENDERDVDLRPDMLKYALEGRKKSQVDEIIAEMKRLDDMIMSLEEEITSVEDDIRGIEEKCNDLDKLIFDTSAEEKYWLRDKKSKLRDEKNILRDEKNIFLKQGPAGVNETQPQE